MEDYKSIAEEYGFDYDACYYGGCDEGYNSAIEDCLLGIQEVSKNKLSFMLDELGEVYIHRSDLEDWLYGNIQYTGKGN